MESLEISAKTVEEAIQQALEQLGLSEQEVDIKVIKSGKSGILGFGSEEAMVRVTPLPKMGPEEQEIATVSEEVLKGILELMNVEATVELKYAYEMAGPDIAPIALDIKGNDLGILIGRRGQTLASLQHIVRLIVAHQLKARAPVTIDVEGYKQRRYRELQELSLSLARKVETSGQSITLEPMPANERRIVHLALTENTNVLTRSIGEGEVRKVIISPQK
jgi:spoIIIJ-associated protein